MYLEENKPLAPFTTFRIGGPARWFVEAESEDDVAEAAAWARGRGVPLFVLGGGSNLLVADGGFEGLVLRIGLKGMEKQDRNSRTIYKMAAGEEWDSFVQKTVADKCAGLECLAGIPGTVGGTPVQNVGAYGQEVASCVERVRVFDFKAAQFVEFAGEDCGFAYRRSRFNTVDAERYVVTRVDYALAVEGPPTLQYAELKREFADRPVPSLSEAAAAVRRIRRSKGMLLIEGDPDCRSAGSFFKNPVVKSDQLRTIASLTGMEPPYFPAGQDLGEDKVKVPAAWLIEQAGFSRGLMRGQAGISSRHTLALINRGSARASEVLALGNEIAHGVETRFGIRLEREPVILGFS
jgi:UDP-N-acetylmuramate dehydrogenase